MRVHVHKHEVVRVLVADFKEHRPELVVDAAGAHALVHGVRERLDLQRRVRRVHRELLQEVHRRLHQRAVEVQPAVQAKRHHGVLLLTQQRGRDRLWRECIGVQQRPALLAKLGFRVGV